jgi:dipeptidyl aminopeptidase/acylaminoacyl peptidase
MKLVYFLLSVLCCNILLAQDAINYQTPPNVISKLVLAKSSPSVSFNDEGTWMLQMERSDMPTVEELAQPELRIAGMRINPNNFGPSRAAYINNLSLKDVVNNKSYTITGLPANPKIGSTSWSPKQDKIAFTNTTNKQIDLYIIDIKTKAAKKINKLPLNEVLTNGVEWLDNNTMYYTVATKPAAAPPKPAAPNGPVVQENLGKTAASRTYQDLLKNAYDEKLFEFYATSQLVKNSNGVETFVGKPAIYSSYSFSPNKQCILTELIKKPFSYLVPVNGFNSSLQILDANGKWLKTIVDLPSSELAPTGADNVLNAPRGHRWNANLPNTLNWIMPLDSGIIKKQVEFHDALYSLNIANPNETPQIIAKTKMRMGGSTSINENLLMVTEMSRAKQQLKMSLVNISSGEIKLIHERSMNDAYKDIGNPITKKNKYGINVPMLINGQTMLMRGTGASPKGDLPFLNEYNFETKTSNELWRCKEGSLESVVAFIDYDNMKFITSKQSPTETPNYYVYENGKAEAITNFADPQPELRKISKEKISYKRSDGIDLTADLYLPENYDKNKNGRLPLIIWAYPREFKNSSDAAQVRGSKYGFVRVNYGSPVFWATQGYAVMDNAEFPIVGEGANEPNDNFIEQLIANAKAAIDKAYELGVGDSTKVAVGGHSYGAFMTANLLAHSKLFKAGIARSGAYNRTLTPFGFQNEERTYWQAPELYFKMSPFSYAHQIKTPMLMIHGEADNNPGTFPIQSERLYNAVKGHGGTVRFVQLPYESHGYAAKENILHMLWEQHQWLEKYVKGVR